MKNAPVLQELFAFRRCPATRSSLLRFHVILPQQRRGSIPSQGLAAFARLQLGREVWPGHFHEIVNCRKRVRLVHADWPPSFHAPSTHFGIAIPPQAKIVVRAARDDRDLPCSDDDRRYSPTDIPPRGPAHHRRVCALKNIPAAAETAAGFAAAQKPSPLALQALGSGQPDQPFASDFPRYDHQ